MAKLILGVNDLATSHPELIKEWDYQKNDPLLPDRTATGSNKKVWWKCPKCGHEWEASGKTRINGQGCPKCKSKKANTK